MLLVCAREVRQRLRSRALVVVTVLFSGVLTLASLAPLVLGPSADDEPAVVAAPTVGVVDGTDELGPAARAALRATAGTDPTLVPVAADALVEVLEGGEIAFVVDPADRRVFAARASGPFAQTVPRSVTEALGTAWALEAADADPALADQVLEAAPAEVEVVATREGVDPDTAQGRFAVAYAGALVLYFALIFGSNLIVTGVVEEKGSRIVELLLPAVPARQLMAGKVLGLGLVGTVQTALIVVPPLLVLAATGAYELPPGITFAGVAIVVAFVLGFALYAGITAGLASLVSRVEDSQAALFPLYALLVAAFLAGFPVLNDPSGTLAQVVTFVPFTAVFVIPSRMVLVDLPLWQVAVSALLVVATSVVVTALAARIYEGAILRSGARVRLRDALDGDRT